MAVPVSVLIPTYNRMELLPETIESVLSQTYEPQEVIVVDDGSTDDTRAAVEHFRSRVVYHRVANGGVCRARNIAASLAASPFLAFCDSDDLWRKNKLELQMKLHLDHPAVQFSFTNFSLVVDGAWSSRTKFDEAPGDYFSGCEVVGNAFLICRDSMYSKVLAFQPIFQSTHLMTRELFTSMGGYQESLGKVLSEDLDFALRCAQVAPVGIVSEAVVGIRKHESNFSGDTHATTVGEVQILHYALKNHSITPEERSEIMNQIYLRNVDVSYGAFRRGDFNGVTAALGDVPTRYLETKDRIRLLISRLPHALAARLQKLLLR